MRNNSDAKKIYKTKQITAMQEHAQRETNQTILAGLRVIEFGNGRISVCKSGPVRFFGPKLKDRDRDRSSFVLELV